MLGRLVCLLSARYVYPIKFQTSQEHWFILFPKQDTMLFTFQQVEIDLTQLSEFNLLCVYL